MTQRYAAFDVAGTTPPGRSKDMVDPLYQAGSAPPSVGGRIKARSPGYAAADMGITREGIRMDDWDVKTIVLGYDGSEGAERAAGSPPRWRAGTRPAILVVTVFHWSYSLDAMGERADQAADEVREP